MNEIPNTTRELAGRLLAAAGRITRACHETPRTPAELAELLELADAAETLALALVTARAT